MNHNTRTTGFTVLTVLAMLGMSSFFVVFHSPTSSGAYASQLLSSSGENDITTGQATQQLVLALNVTHDNTDSQGYTMIQLRLYDNRTNQIIRFVTYDLGITHENLDNIAANRNNLTNQAESAILQDLFQSESGILTLKIIYDPAATATKISANREPFLNAAQADPGGVITIRTPFIRPDGDYLLYAKVVSAFYPTNIFADKGSPEAVFHLSREDSTKVVHLVPGCIVIENNGTNNKTSSVMKTTSAGNGTNAVSDHECEPTSSSLINPQSKKMEQEKERLEAAESLRAADLPALEYARGYLVSHDVAVSGKNVYAVLEKNVSARPDLPLEKIFLVSSHDAGITFGNSVNVTGSDVNSSVPKVSASGDNLYILYIVQGIHGGAFGVRFAASHDTGKAFDPILQLDNETQGAVATIRHSSYNASIYHESTQPEIASSGKNVYVAWLDNTNGIEHVIFTASHDEGRTFEPTIALENKLTSLAYLRIVVLSPSLQPQAAASSSSSAGLSSFSQTADDDDSSVYVVWEGQKDKSGRNNVIALNASHDAGQTFGHTAYLDVFSEKDPSVEIQNLQVAAAADKNVYFLWQNPATNDYRLMFTKSNEDCSETEEPISLGTNQNNIPSQKLLASGNDVYVLWQGSSNAPSGTYGLLVASSHDGGETFGDAVKVGQNAGDSWVTDPKILAVGGHVYVVWEESQQVFFDISKDGGKTFQKPIVLSP